MKFIADRCLIIHNEDCCQECGAFGRVFGLVFPHETSLDSEGPTDAACSEGYALSLTYIAAIATTLDNHLIRLGATMRMSHSKTASTEYLANHCPHCDALRGDYYLWKPEGPFWPFDNAPQPTLELVAEPVWVRAEQWGSVPLDLTPYGDFESPEIRRGSRKQRP